jgi:hypothetical protein
MELIKSYQELPRELVHIILDFDGHIKYSSNDGKYMNQINKLDYRYLILANKKWPNHKLACPIILHNNYHIQLLNTNNNYFIIFTKYKSINLSIKYSYQIL